TTGACLPAAPLHAHSRLLRGFRQGSRYVGCLATGGGLFRRRSADRRRGRPLARPRATGGRHGRACVVAGKVEPIFAETIDELTAALQEFVRDGDVVITMGAGSIGQVPARLAGAGAE